MFSDYISKIISILNNIKMIFRQIYALLRGDSSPRKDRILNPSKSKTHQWSEVKFTFPDGIEELQYTHTIWNDSHI